MSQVLGNLESQKRQYQMAESARDTGFAAIQVIDEDLVVEINNIDDNEPAPPRPRWVDRTLRQPNFSLFKFCLPINDVYGSRAIIVIVYGSVGRPDERPS